MIPHFTYAKQSANRPFPSYVVPLFQNESSCENEFDLHENEPVDGTHFHMNGFALRLVLTRRQKGIRKWPIEHSKSNNPCSASCGQESFNA